VGDAAAVMQYLNLTQSWLHTDAAREKTALQHCALVPKTTA